MPPLSPLSTGTLRSKPLMLSGCQLDGTGTSSQWWSSKELSRACVKAWQKVCAKQGATFVIDSFERVSFGSQRIKFSSLSIFFLMYPNGKPNDKAPNWGRFVNKYHSFTLQTSITVYHAFPTSWNHQICQLDPCHDPPGTHYWAKN
jgi:hypothetical protein